MKDFDLGKIEDLVSREWYIYVIAFYLLSNHLKVWKINDSDPNSKLIAQELNFIVSKYLQQPNRSFGIVSVETVKSMVDETRKFMEDLHNQFFDFPNLWLAMEKWLDEEELYKVFEEARRSSGTMSEPIFYWESWAYDFQYYELFPKLYKYDKDIIEDRLWVTFENLVAFISQTQEIFNFKLNQFMNGWDLWNLQWMLNVSLVDKYDYKWIDRTELDIIFNLFLTKLTDKNDSYKHPLDYSIVEWKPLIELDDWKILLSSIQWICKSLYTSPFFWLKEISADFDKQVNNRWKAVEDITYSFFSRHLWPKRVYKNVKLYKWKNEVWEIDVLLVFWTYMIVVQCKSKKMTKVAMKWDIEEYLKDFSKAIQDPYDQWISCKNYLIEWWVKVIVDDKEVIFDEELTDWFIVCITADHFPKTITDRFEHLKIKEWEISPLCLSLFSLDVLTFYLSDIYELLYYLRQRALYHDKILANSEWSILWFHLSNKLWFEDREATMITIRDDYWYMIDSHYLVAKWYLPPNEESDELLKKRKNGRFEKMIEDIKSLHTHKLDKLILFLYDVVWTWWDDLIEVIDKMKMQWTINWNCRDASCEFRWWSYKAWITFMLFPKDYKGKQERLIWHCSVRKYKSKLNNWLWIWIIEWSGRDIDLVCFNDSDRVKDQELEEQSKLFKWTPYEINPITNKFEKVKVWRNDKCPCWSWKKYKKCCLNIIK